AANRELQERELIKLATLGAAIARALRARGVQEPTASLTAEVGIAVFKTAFVRWLDQGQDHEHDLARLMRQTLEELIAITSNGHHVHNSPSNQRTSARRVGVSV
ncbi:MAG TPA: hypothetical protein VGK33_09710, partial [Chloroflexota bacterium]